MSTIKIMILSVAALIMLSMVLFMTQFLLCRVKAEPEDKTPGLATGIWFITLFVSGVLLINRTIVVFAEAIDTIYKTNPTDALLNIFKTGSLLTGITILWLLIWYFLSNSLSIAVTQKKNARQEAEAGNYVFFIIRGIISIGFLACLLPAFELILRTFIPNIDITFYH